MRRGSEAASVPARARLQWVLRLILLLGISARSGVNATDFSAALPGKAVPTVSTDLIARTGFFYVGGSYVGEPGKEVMHGAMYVEVMVPRKLRHANPILFLHGVGQTAATWLQTPDGRPGWAHYFVAQGYVVYLPDLPGRGRSAFVPNFDGELGLRTAAELAQLWTASDRLGHWPQASAYSQWPGTEPRKGEKGERVFDDFARSQVQFPTTGLDQAVLEAGIDLLDRIGTRVVLLTHSQGGAFGWSLADARPRQVAAIIAVEPAGPPIRGVDVGRQAYSDRPNLRWGVTNLPLHYEPPIQQADELQVALEQQAAAPGRMACFVQSGSPHRLTNLADVPVLLVSAQAGYHRSFDACTAKWLQQAGVPAQYVELENVGLRGNGHMMMLEKNSDRIAAYFSQWLRRLE